jgi:hypothetical protein
MSQFLSFFTLRVLSSLSQVRNKQARAYNGGVVGLDGDDISRFVLAGQILRRAGECGHVPDSLAPVPPLSVTISRTIDGVMAVSWQMTSFTKLWMQPGRLLALSPAARADSANSLSRKSRVIPRRLRRRIAGTLRRLHNRIPEPPNQPFGGDHATAIENLVRLISRAFTHIPSPSPTIFSRNQGRNSHEIPSFLESHPPYLSEPLALPL